MSVDLRLAVVAGFAWALVAVLLGVSGLEVGAVAVLWSASGLALVGALRWRRVSPTIPLALAAAALVVTSMALQTAERTPTELVVAADRGTEIELVVETTGSARPTTVAVDVLQAPAASIRVPAVLFVDRAAGRIPVGATITVRATIVETDPGDRAAFLIFPSADITDISPPGGPIGAADRLRETMLTLVEPLPGAGGMLLPGLAIGDTSHVSLALDDAMTTSSLTHLTAVSGANCAIVVALVMGLGAAAGMPRSARLAVAILSLAGFVLLVTPEPSVMRAAAMTGVVLLAQFRGRLLAGVPVLALVVLVLLVADPWLAREYGFVLSVLATAGLLLVAGPLAARLERVMPAWIALVIAIPVSAQLACQPVLVLLDASIPTYGVIANVLAAPAAPVATILGLAGCLLGVVLPPLASLIVTVAWLPAAWIAAVAEFFSALPGARLPWWEGGLGAAAFLVLVALTIAVIVGARFSRGVAALLVLCVAVYVGAAIVAPRLAIMGRPHDWQIAMCDVGQGDATVVRSAGAVALIDTGPDPAPLAECLDELGIHRIDLLVLTHFDLDHIGGVAAVTGMVAEVITGVPAGDTDEQIIASLTALGARAHPVNAGMTGLLGDLRWTVLWPTVRGVEAGNEASVVLGFEGVGTCTDGCLTSLFLGDLGEEPQRRLLREIVAVDVVKVSHHGSADQSEPLYRQAEAPVGLIGVGASNRYGHPDPRLLTILTEAGTQPFRTDLSGLLLVSASEGGVVVWSERSDGR